MALTKAQIVSTIQNHLGLSRTDRRSELVETLLENIKKTLENNEDV